MGQYCGDGAISPTASGSLKPLHWLKAIQDPKGKAGRCDDPQVGFGWPCEPEGNADRSPDNNLFAFQLWWRRLLHLRKDFKSFLSMGDRIVIQCHSSGTKSRTITRQARSDGQYEDLTKIWVPFRGVRSMVLLPTASFEL